MIFMKFRFIFIGKTFTFSTGIPRCEKPLYSYGFRALGATMTPQAPPRAGGGVWGVIVVGGGGGRLKGGRHLQYPKDTPMNNLLVSMLDKAGLPAEQFGDSTGRISELAGV